MLELTVNAMLAVLVATIALWLVVYGRMQREPGESATHLRWHQWLVGLIAFLTIVLAIVIVLSSDPGEADLYLLGY